MLKTPHDYGHNIRLLVFSFCEFLDQKTHLICNLNAIVVPNAFVLSRKQNRLFIYINRFDCADAFHIHLIRFGDRISRYLKLNRLYIVIKHYIIEFHHFFFFFILLLYK